MRLRVVIDKVICESVIIHIGVQGKQRQLIDKALLELLPSPLVAKFITWDRIPHLLA